MITSASMRGSTSPPIGSSADRAHGVDLLVTCIVPICAVKALPERPATMIAVSSTPELADMPMPTGQVDGEDLGAELPQLLPTP